MKLKAIYEAELIKGKDKGKRLEVWDYVLSEREALNNVGEVRRVIYKERQKYNGNLEITFRKVKILKLVRIEKED